MKRIFLILGILFIASVACNLNMGESQGGEVRMDEAGFSVVVPNGYEMNSFFGELSFTKKNADVFEGPTYHFSVYDKNDNYPDDPNWVMDDYVHNVSQPNEYTNQIQFTRDRFPVSFNGFNGIALDFIGTTPEEGKPIAGRVIVANLPDGRVLKVDGTWPEAENTTNLVVFQELLESIKIFEPINPTSES